MSLDLWLLFVVTEAALCVSPGPAVLYVTSQGITRGFRSSLLASLGIVSGNVVYFAASALGLGTLILASGELFTVVKWCGAAYLIWLGVRMFLGASAQSALSAARVSSIRPGRIYRTGVIVQLANPKNLVFFIAILPPFIAPAGNVPLQILILGVTSQVIEIVVLCGYGALASGAGRWLRRSRFEIWADRVAGSLVAGVGVALAFVRRAEA